MNHKNSRLKIQNPILRVVLLHILLLFFLQAGAAYAQEVNIERGEIEWHKYHDNIFIETSDYIIPKVEKQGDKIILDFKPSKTKGFKVFNQKSSRVASVRSLQYKDDISRVVVELLKNVDFEIASLYGKNQTVIEISDCKEQIPLLAYEDGKKVAQKGEGKKEGNRNTIETEKVSNPYISMKRDSLFAVNVAAPLNLNNNLKKSKELKEKIIVIDPGHGGEDPGAIGCEGTVEKNLTLKTSLYLAEYLKASGAKVFLTRKTDIKKSLQDIVQFTNSIGADAYVAVHFNYIDKPKAGTETYYYTAKSLRLASLVHKRMLLMLKRDDRCVKRTKFYTISRTNMPAILVEPVFLTNREEAALVQTSSFQKKIAESIALGLKDFFSR